MQKNDVVSHIEYGKSKIKVEINNELIFSMSKRMYKVNRVNIGDYICLVDYQEWYNKERRIEALQKAVNLLAIRARSTGEILQSLIKKDYSSDVANYVVNRLLKEKFLDDEEFASMWVESRIKQQIGKNRIKAELISKGISRFLIEDTFERCEYEKFAPAEAQKLARKYVLKYRDKPDIEAKHKTIQALARKGYSYETARTAVNEILADK